MPAYQAVIFDLDGTLLNTLEDLADSTNCALAACGCPPRTLEEIRTFVGNGVEQLIRRAVPPDCAPEREAECLSSFRAHYLQNMEQKTAPYPGIPPLLDRLETAGLKLAVVSNKFDGAVKGLCARYFGSRIPVAIGEGPETARKPAPDGVRRALAELGCGPEAAVYVGDSEVDLLTARNAGLPCISVTWGFRPRALLLERGAVLLADTPEELAELILLGAAG